MPVHVPSGGAGGSRARHRSRQDPRFPSSWTGLYRGCVERLAAHEPRVVASAAAELVGAEADGRAVRRQLHHGWRRCLALRRRAPAWRPGRARGGGGGGGGFVASRAADLSRVGLCTDSSSLISPVAAAALEVSVVPVPVALDGRPFESSVDAFYDRMRAGSAATSHSRAPVPFSPHTKPWRATERRASCAAPRRARVRSRCIRGGRGARRLDPCDGRRSSDGQLRRRAMGSRSARRSRRRRDQDAGCHHGAEARGRARQRLRRPRRTARAPPRDQRLDVLRFADGVATPVSSHPTIEDATEAMTRRIAGSGTPSHVAVGYASREVEAAADRLAHDLLRAGVAPVGRYRVEPSVGAHTGPDSFGAFWRPAEASVSSW